MSDSHATPHFHNDAGDVAIAIGVRQFMCVGASPPLDHPHVFLDMGKRDAIVCTYCSTRYVFRPDLAPTDSDPPGHLLVDLVAS